jgi:hypothetical protein
VTAALAVLLGLSTPLRVPDLQVEATTTAGVELPELADAVARALVVSGARVVLRGPSSGPCLYCAKVAVFEAEQGSCRVEVQQEQHTASAKMQFPVGSPLFDRARAIAIQARLLVTWETNPDARSKDAVAPPSARKSERRNPMERTSPKAHVVMAEPTPLPFQQAELVPGPKPQSTPVQIPAPMPERRVRTELVEPALSVDRVGASPVDRAESKKIEPASARPERELPAELAVVRLEPRTSRWPWIPTVVGSGAAVMAGICAVLARDRYNALSDKSQPYQAAQTLKSDGQSWQVASFVLSGVAVAGLTTGLIGFATRSSERSSLSAVAAPMAGGGMIAVAGDWP